MAAGFSNTAYSRADRKVDQLEAAFDRSPFDWPEALDDLEALRTQLEAFAQSGSPDDLYEAAQHAREISEAPRPNGVTEKNLHKLRKHARRVGNYLADVSEQLTDPDSNGEFAPHPFPADSFDPANIPPRPWILGHRLQRGLVGALAAAPGTGKSSLQIVSALSLVTGLELTGERVHEAGPAWILNNEDAQDELDRRIAAACDRHGISYRQLAHLYRNSGLSDQRFVVTERTATGDLVATPKVQACIDHIRRNQIVALFVDPAVSTHTAQENSNDEIERVAELYRQIAHEAGCAIEIAAHTTKTHTGDPETIAGRLDALRGAGALAAAVRSAWTLCGMSEATAEKHRLEPVERRRLVRLDEAKPNQAIGTGEPTWFQLASQTIANGDNVGVIRPYDLEAVSQERNCDAQRERDEAEEPTRSSVAQLICDAMPACGEMPMKDAAPIVADALGLAERTAREKIKRAIPSEPAYRTVRNASGLWQLKIRIQGTSAKAARTIVRDLQAAEVSDAA